MLNEFKQHNDFHQGSYPAIVQQLSSINVKLCGNLELIKFQCFVSADYHPLTSMQEVNTEEED